MKRSTKAAINLTIDDYTDALVTTLTSTAVEAHIAGDIIAYHNLKIPVAEFKVQQAALDFGKDYRKLLKNEGASIIQGKKIPWLADHTKHTRDQVYQIVEAGLKEGKPVASIGGKTGAPGTIADDLKSLAIRDKDYEYVRIARTETARVQNQGTLNRYTQNKITHVNVIDGGSAESCDECTAINGSVWTVEYSMTHELEHPNCFIDSQIPIFTSEGWKQIGKILVGDLVLTHTGRFRKVTDTFKIPNQRVNVVKIGVGESITTRRYITVTDEHPIMINGEWSDAKNITTYDKVNILAKKCQHCDTVIPWWRTNCSLSCGSREQMIEQRKDPVWIEKSRTEQKKKMKELYDDEDYRKIVTRAANIRTREMVEEGTHPFQQYKNHVKGNRVLAQNKYRSFLEKKMEWLLSEMDLNFTAQPIINRPETVINNTNGGMRQRYYKPDFILTDYNIIIECDGDYWHDSTDEYEINRQAYLESLGYVVLRFSQSDIRENLSHCADTLRRVMMNHDHEYMFLQMKVESVMQYTPEKAKTLYNLSVEEDESFIAKGFVVHNCVRAFSPVIPDDWEPPE